MPYSHVRSVADCSLLPLSSFEQRILERGVPLKWQAEQKVSVSVEQVRRARPRVERRRATGEGEARRGDFVVVHVQPVHVDAELDVVRALVPAGVHHPLPLRIEVVEHRRGVVVDADAVAVRAPDGVEMSMRGME